SWCRNRAATALSNGRSPYPVPDKCSSGWARWEFARATWRCLTALAPRRTYAIPWCSGTNGRARWRRSAIRCGKSQSATGLLSRATTSAGLAYFAGGAHDDGRGRRLGATRLVNLQREDARAVVNSLTGGRGADVVFEAAGHIDAVPLAFDLARRGGTVVLEGIAGGSHRLALDPDLFCLKDLRVEGIFAYTSSVFTTTISLMSSGVLRVGPLITRV